MSCCFFVTASIVQEFWRGAVVRREGTGTDLFTAMVGLVGRNKRRYGGFVVHLGVMLAIVGITGSSVFKQEATASLKRGESFSLGRYTMRFDDLVSQETPNHEFMGARLAIFEATGPRERWSRGRTSTSRARIPRPRSTSATPCVKIST